MTDTAEIDYAFKRLDICDSKSGECRFPVEVWEEIFAWATHISGKDEFSKDYRCYRTTSGYGDIYSSIFTHTEVSDIINTRRAIVQTCKTWYSIGIRALYSHLKIEYDTQDIILAHLQDKLAQSPTLAEAVKRLTVTAGRRTSISDRQAVNKLSSYIDKVLVPVLSHLQILSFPEGFAPLDTTQAPIVIVEPTSGIGPIYFGTVWDKLSTLTISSQSRWLASSSNLEKLILPSLESLSITTTQPNTIESITNQWKTPALRSLTLSSENAPAWSNFLRQCGSTLHYLCMLTCNTAISPLPGVSLPVLIDLTLRSVDHDLWVRAIDAPCLKGLTIYDLNNLQDILTDIHGAWIGQFTSAFPTLKSLKLRPSIPYAQLSMGPSFNMGFGDRRRIDNSSVYMEVLSPLHQLQPKPLQFVQPQTYISTSVSRAPAPKKKKKESKQTKREKALLRSLDNTNLQVHPVHGRNGTVRYQAWSTLYGYRMFGKTKGTKDAARDDMISKLLSIY